MLITLLIITSLLLALIIPFYPEFTYTILKIELILYVAILVKDIAVTRKFTLLHTWEVAFVFIIWSNMILSAADDHSHLYTNPIVFYLVANSIVLIAYFNYHPSKTITNKTIFISSGRNTELLLFIAISLGLYLYFNYDKVVETLIFGRVLSKTLGSGSLLTTIIPALGMILPAIIAYYFKYIIKGNTIFAIILALPIFIYQFIIATRFQLLFQIFPFFIILGLIKIRKINFKSICFMVIFAIALGWGSSYLKENRNYASNDSVRGEYVYASEKRDDIFYSLADNLSSEGIIEMMSMADDYYKNHDLEYGKESAYMLYFWVPRSWWPEKPTPIDHWLIRKYEIVAEEHSTSVGFLGFLRADFGWFAILFALLWGIAIKQCDNYISRTLTTSTPSFSYVFAATLYPYIFFAVRSPQTATQQLIFIYFIYLIFKFIFFKKIGNNYANASSNKLYS